jgi:hypothetical protein
VIEQELRDVKKLLSESGPGKRVKQDAGPGKAGSGNSVRINDFL